MLPNDGILVGRIRGIPIRIHLTWLLAALLIAWSLAGSYFRRAVGGYTTDAYWAAGIAVTILFFGSLLVHELAHSLVALSRGAKVRGITLYLFGGVSQIESELKTPGDELRVTIVGPLASFALAALFGTLWYAVDGISALADAALGYLAVINLFLGLFNLLPGLPLDGGRVLRALVWRRSGDPAHATRVAAWSGVAIGYLMVAVGIVYVFTGFWVNGLWLVFLGWYLQSVAEQERRQAAVHSLLAGLTVGNLTDADAYVVAPEMPLDRAVNDVMLAHQIRALPVVAGDQFRGLLTLRQIGAVPRDRWPVTTAAQAMIPADQVAIATPDEPAEQAIAEMQRRDLNQEPVLRNGHVVGLLNRESIVRQLEVRARLRDEAQSRR